MAQKQHDIKKEQIALVLLEALREKGRLNDAVYRKVYFRLRNKRKEAA